jgi:hypothetical protein
VRSLSACWVGRGATPRTPSRTSGRAIKCSQETQWALSHPCTVPVQILSATGMCAPSSCSPAKNISVTAWSPGSGCACLPRASQSQESGPASRSMNLDLQASKRMTSAWQVSTCKVFVVSGNPMFLCRSLPFRLEQPPWHSRSPAFWRSAPSPRRKSEPTQGLSELALYAAR